MCVEKKFAKEYNSGIEALSHINPGNAFACNRMKIFDHYGIFVGWIDGVAWAIHFSGKGEYEFKNMYIFNHDKQMLLFFV